MDIEKYENYKDLITFNEKIESLYNKLADLEINGKFLSDEYNETLEYIKIILNVIDSKLNLIDCSDPKFIEFEETLEEINGVDGEDYDSIMDILELSTQNVINRTIMNLSNLTLEQHAYYLEVGQDDDYDEELDNDLVEDTEEDLERYLEEDNNLLSLIEIEDNMQILNDKLFFHTLMDYLLEAINNETNKHVKRELIRVKYRLIYTIKSLEISFVNNPDNFTKTKIYQGMLQNSLSDYPSSYEEEYLIPNRDNIIYELKCLSALGDIYYKKESNRIKALLKVIYIKSCLSLNYSVSMKKYLDDFKNDLLDKTDSSYSRKNIIGSFALRKELCLEIS